MSDEKKQEGESPDGTRTSLERPGVLPRSGTLVGTGSVPNAASAKRDAAGLAVTEVREKQRSLFPGKRPGLEPGTVIGERYALVKRVGSGAFGDVYRATDAEVKDHVVALKLLHEPARNELARTTAMRELQLIASVFHPSIVQFKDHGWYEDRLWFVMPWYEGETLEARMERKPLSRVEARRIFEPLVRALATMHGAGLRHQDIKPENILLARIRGFARDEGAEEILPVLLDLGVAAKASEMLLAGTPTYFAPEVAAHFASPGEGKPLTTAADVFALALALRNALEPDTQDVPPEGGLHEFIAERATRPPAAPKSEDLTYLAPAFSRWLALDPISRPSANELAEELAVLTEPEERRARRNAILKWAIPVTFASLAVFASVVLALVQTVKREQEETQRAQSTANELRDDLAETEAQREALDEARSTLQEQYESSQLTRHDLVEKLSETEASLDQTRGSLGRVRSNLAEMTSRQRTTASQLATTQGELTTVTAQRAQLETQLGETRSTLESERRRSADLDARRTQLEAQLAQAQQETAREASARQAAEARVAQSATELAAAQGAEARATERVSALEREQVALREAASAAQREAEAARARVRELEARVRALESAPPAPPAPPPTP